jgi:exodeoxyribonuclease VII large subunit
MDIVANELNNMQQSLVSYSTDLLLREKNRLQLLGSRLPSIAISRIERNRSQLQMLGNRLPIAASNLLNRHGNQLHNRQTAMQQSLQKQLADKTHFLKLTEQFIKMASPDYILKRGYSMTLKNGKIIKRATAFTTGDELTTRFTDGEVKSRVL